MYTKALMISAFLCFVSCTKEEITARKYPRVMTREVVNVVNGTATFNGEITFTSTAVIDYGFIWAISGFPTLTNGENKSLGQKDGTGKFVFTVTQGLQVGKGYLMCAYARSSQYIVYGNQFYFVSK